MTLSHPHGTVSIEELGDGRREVSATLSRPDLFMPCARFVTTYPPEIIEQILDVQGPERLCDELRREEDAGFVERNMRALLFSYLPAEQFAGARVLDFGCGTGTSTMVLARLVPDVEIVGVELDADRLALAKAKAAFRGRDNVSFHVSPDGSSFPEGLGTFDYVMLNAVFEHLLPDERRVVLPLLWDALEPGGVLFLGETPHRGFPVEGHTTGLPLVNYLPASLALRAARRSRRLDGDEPWERLLRMGIRGGTAREIMRVLAAQTRKPTLLRPEAAGLRSHADVWFAEFARGGSLPKRVAIAGLALLRRVGVPLTPTMYVAVRKGGE